VIQIVSLMFAETLGRVREPAVDALQVEDALLEAQYCGHIVDLVRGRAALLFDTRGALMIREGNAAMVEVFGVTAVAEELIEERLRASVWIVMRSRAYATDALSFVVDLLPEGSIRVKGTGLRFTLLDVEALSPVPADLKERPPDSPGWLSDGVVISASSRWIDKSR
jgi:hypothetical protein